MKPWQFGMLLFSVYWAPHVTRAVAERWTMLVIIVTVGYYALDVAVRKWGELREEASD